MNSELAENVAPTAVDLEKTGDTSTEVTGRQYMRRRATDHPVRHAAVNALWLCVAVVDIILICDLLFRLFKVSDVGFADSIFTLGSILATPFDAIFNQIVGASTVGLVRWGDVMAIGMYTLVGLAIFELFAMAGRARAAD